MVRRWAFFLLLGGMVLGCVTEPAFRGRWWSYYERGASFLASGDYAQAEADFRQALIGRSRDSWQARTYGLHFVDYFPNRELGVTYFHTGDLDKAEECLRKSLAQIDTARAHYYLDSVVRKKIAEGALQDTAKPSLEASVEDGAVVGRRELVLQVRAADDVGVAAVNLNGAALPQRGSATQLEFQDTLLLTEGRHEIVIEAGDLAGKSVSRTLAVEVDLTGPTIGIFTPRDSAATNEASVEVTGVCIDKNGVASVSLDGRPLAQAEGAARVEFNAACPLTEGGNTFVIAATDVAGNETRSAVRVYRGRPGSPAARFWELRQRAPRRLEYAQADGAAVPPQGPPAEPVAIELRSPRPDAPYRHNKTLCIAGDAIAATKVAALVINGEPVAELTGAPKETFSKRIPIDVAGPARVHVSVQVQDDQGHTAEQAFEAPVEPVLIDSPESKLPVAVLAFAGQSLEPALPDMLRLTTESKLVDGRRFRILDRTRLQDVLTEQQLAAALANPDEAIALGKLTNAYVFLVADVFSHETAGLEIKTRAINAETSDIIVTLDAFIADRASREAVETACNELAAGLAKVFPRLSGEVLSVKAAAGGPEMLLNWTREDGIREGAYLLVVKQGEPWVDETTGQVLEPGEFREVSRARIMSILTQASKAKAVSREGQDVQIDKGMAAVTL